MGEDLLPLLSEDADFQLGGVKSELTGITIVISDKRRENFHDDGGELVVDGDLAQMQKSMALFANVPSFGNPTSIDPFVNKTPRVSGAYENAKTVLLLPLLILRLLVVGAILVVGFFATKIALAGWEKGQVVLPRWRRQLMGVTRLCGRGILYCFGWVVDLCKKALFRLPLCTSPPKSVISS